MWFQPCWGELSEDETNHDSSGNQWDGRFLFASLGFIVGGQSCGDVVGRRVGESSTVFLVFKESCRGFVEVRRSPQAKPSIQWETLNREKQTLSVNAADKNRGGMLTLIVWSEMPTLYLDRNTLWCILATLLSCRLVLLCCLNTNTSGCGQWTRCYSHLCKVRPMPPWEVWLKVSAGEAAGNKPTTNQCIDKIVWSGLANSDTFMDY